MLQPIRKKSQKSDRILMQFFGEKKNAPPKETRISLSDEISLPCVAVPRPNLHPARDQVRWVSGFGLLGVSPLYFGFFARFLGGEGLSHTHTHAHTHTSIHTHFFLCLPKRNINIFIK